MAGPWRLAAKPHQSLLRPPLARCLPGGPALLQAPAEELVPGLSLEPRDTGVPAHVGVQRLLLRAEGVEEVEGHLPVVSLVVPLQQDKQRDSDLPRFLDKARGTQLPANGRAAEMRGSTAASRTPMAITPPEYPKHYRPSLRLESFATS
jgi:hypothetical protein